MRQTTSELVDQVGTYQEITLATIPIAIVAILLLVLLPGMVILGRAMGRAQAARANSNFIETNSSTGDTTLTAFLAMLGFLLAFTFGHALNTADFREDTVIDEAAAIGTAFLLTDFLNDPDRGALQHALLDYAKTRIVGEGHNLRTRAQTQQMLSATLAEQSKLWPLTMEALSNSTASDPMKITFALAVTEVLDVHLVRTKTLSLPISEFSSIMLLLAAATAMLVLGNRAGLRGYPLSWRSFVLSGFLVLLMYAIVDTQRGEEGLIRTDQSALRGAIYEMEAALKAE